MTVFSMTNKSIFVLRKQSSASSGLQTMKHHRYICNRAKVLESAVVAAVQQHANALSMGNDAYLSSRS
jgi:hypothetical protein